MCSDHDSIPPLSPMDPLVREAPFAGEVIPLEPVDSIGVTTVCDNTIDMLLLDEGPAERLMGRSGEAPMVAAATLEEGKVVDAPLAQHGFSVHLSVTKGDAVHRMLFDTGVTPNGCRDNLARLGLDVGDVEAVVLSHGHFDHTTGLSGLASTLGRAGLPVVLHPEFWTRRRIAIPGRDPLELPTTSRRGLADAGFDVIEHRRPSFLFEGSVLVTGEVERTSGFEAGFAIHQAYRNHAWEPDPLIRDDQAFIAHVSGKGLVVISGCGHAGISNTCRYAQRLTGVERIYAVIGGFHLNGPLFESIIGPTCEAFSELAPEVIVPSHCTGWRATHALAARFPSQFIQNSVGTTFSLTSALAA
jgi:7,8-dihydropterin-6-yl-methyl-4-(beta-D-ribofuranosyl)aminobenzene 5'-phosphate synthase